jgi:predicted DNA-binding transcriptional regulator AlpA
MNASTGTPRQAAPAAPAAGPGAERCLCGQAKERFLKNREVAFLLGCDRKTVYRRQRADPDFPKPRELAPGLYRYLYSETIAYILSRPIAKRGPDNSNGATQPEKASG